MVFGAHREPFLFEILEITDDPWLSIANNTYKKLLEGTNAAITQLNERDKKTVFEQNNIVCRMRRDIFQYLQDGYTSKVVMKEENSDAQVLQLNPIDAAIMLHYAESIKEGVIRSHAIDIYSSHKYQTQDWFLPKNLVEFYSKLTALKPKKTPESIKINSEQQMKLKERIIKLTNLSADPEKIQNQLTSFFTEIDTLYSQYKYPFVRYETGLLYTPEIMDELCTDLKDALIKTLQAKNRDECILKLDVLYAIGNQFFAYAEHVQQHLNNSFNT